MGKLGVEGDVPMKPLAMMTVTPADLMIADLRAELKDTLNIVHFFCVELPLSSEHPFSFKTEKFIYMLRISI